MSYTRILSIDGGGIRGIIPGQILTVLEKLLQKYSNNPNGRISDYFDLIAGTSTGGILTLLYLCPNKPTSKKARYTAMEAVSLYTENGASIFNRTLYHKLVSLCGIAKPKYSSKQFEELLNKYFGNIKLSELLKPCLITSYDIHSHNAMFFNKLSALKNPDHDFFIRDIARATSSAPTYFPISNIKSSIDKSYPLVDGGVFANNPTVCAYTEASKLERNSSPRDMLILSLGTGTYDTGYKFETARTWGKISWLLPLINIIMAGESTTADYQLKTLFRTANTPAQYLRINTCLKGYGADIYNIDNASHKNIELLKKLGLDAASMHFKELDEFARLLIK